MFAHSSDALMLPIFYFARFSRLNAKYFYCITYISLLLVKKFIDSSFNLLYQQTNLSSMFLTNFKHIVAVDKTDKRKGLLDLFHPFRLSSVCPLHLSIVTATTATIVWPRNVTFIASVCLNVRNVHNNKLCWPFLCAVMCCALSIARDRMEVLVLKGLMIIGDNPQSRVNNITRLHVD